MPIFQSAMFEYAGETSYHDLKYIRLNNTPTQAALHDKLAALENGEAAVATASGMAAISTTLLTVLTPGDHLLAQDCLYGGTHDFMTQELKQLGIETDFIDPDDPPSWKKFLRANTRAIYVETISNPLMRVPDLEAVVQFAKSHELVSLIDNTFATPVNFRPLERGFDLVLHSCTKYLNGHSDIVAGAVIGSTTWIERITHRLNHLGGSLDPHACFLLDRGLKTLVLRVRHQCENALAISRQLESHPMLENVNYPGLTSHPQHARARNLFERFSGMLSFELKGGAVHAIDDPADSGSQPRWARDPVDSTRVDESCGDAPRGSSQSGHHRRSHPYVCRLRGCRRDHRRSRAGPRNPQPQCRRLVEVM
jgi:cystathionine beta-lyase/cystathionine gamma-synthase